MGGCVMSVMERRNEATLVPSQPYRDRLRYGDVNVKCTADTASESGTYRRARLTDAAHDYFFTEWVKEPNLLEILQKNCAERADRPALAYRQVLKTTRETVIVKNNNNNNDNNNNNNNNNNNPVERVFEYTHLASPTHISYAALWELVVSFGRGLVAIQHEKNMKNNKNKNKNNNNKNNKDDDDDPIVRVALYEETRWEWLVSMLGLWTQEMVGVTVYANLGPDALLYALRESACGAVILNGKAVKRLLEVCAAHDIADSVFIYLDELPEEGLDPQGHTLLSWQDVLEKGREMGRRFDEQKAAAAAAAEPTADDSFLTRYAVKLPTDNDTIVLIMYTSGTTGNPKGVMHSIGALTQGAKGLETMLSELIGGEADGETYICYLPAAHIFEFICEIIFLSRGILLCFGSPRTLTDVFARPCGDITCYKPFFLIGVPRIFETIKKTVEGKLPPIGSFKRNIFERAYESRLRALKEGKDTPFWNEKVFNMTRQLMGGGSMRGICSGGAPLADKTQEWINVVLGVPVAQGYGMTETVCNATVQRTGELSCVAGQLLHGVEAKLIDTEEYKHTDKPNPRGELCLRGNVVFKGYFKQEALTKETLLPDGWIRTGDVAEMDVATGNNMKIIGRVKALAKNVLGEYIALESLEALYSSHPVVTPNGIVVLVDPQKPYITAIVLTDESKAMKFAKEKNIPGTWPEILEADAFNNAVAKDMSALALREGKMKFECLQQVRVLADEWTPENGLVTASLKVRRSAIDKHYANVIAELFKK